MKQFSERYKNFNISSCKKKPTKYKPPKEINQFDILRMSSNKPKYRYERGCNCHLLYRDAQVFKSFSDYDDLLDFCKSNKIKLIENKE